MIDDLYNLIADTAPLFGPLMSPDLRVRPGWGSDSSIFRYMVTKHRPATIIELGSWLGHSAISMAESCLSCDLEAKIICVDTWTGSADHWLDDEYRHQLQVSNGYPTIYYQFLSNIRESDVSDMIIPLPMTTMAASVVLARFGVKADLIYIDAGHETESVKMDIERYWPLLSGGVMFGHDAPQLSVLAALKGYNYSISDVDSDFWVLGS